MAHPEYAPCIEACIRCALECEHCGSACLGELDVAAMAACVRLDQDCAALCWQTAAFMSRGSPFLEGLCRLCAEVCDACGEECSRHEQENCQRCALACRHCAEECRRLSGVPMA